MRAERRSGPADQGSFTPAERWASRARAIARGRVNLVNFVNFIGNIQSVQCPRNARCVNFTAGVIGNAF
jgi:hypothetical protein